MMMYRCRKKLYWIARIACKIELQIHEIPLKIKNSSKQKIYLSVYKHNTAVWWLNYLMHVTEHNYYAHTPLPYVTILVTFEIWLSLFCARVIQKYYIKKSPNKESLYFPHFTYFVTKLMSQFSWIIDMALSSCANFIFLNQKFA